MDFTATLRIHCNSSLPPHMAQQQYDTDLRNAQQVSNCSWLKNRNYFLVTLCASATENEQCWPSLLIRFTVELVQCYRPWRKTVVGSEPSALLTTQRCAFKNLGNGRNVAKEKGGKKNPQSHLLLLFRL